MDRFVIRVSRKSSESDISNAEQSSTSIKRPYLVPQARLTPAHTEGAVILAHDIKPEE